MKIIKSFLAVLSGLVCSVALAGGYSVGNGGFGVEDNGRLYLYDLWQAGIAHNPHVGSAIDKDILRRLKQFESMALFPTTTLAKKLTELNAIPGTPLGDFILKGIEMYEWRMTPLPLKPAPDLDPILTPGDKTLVALAVRLNNTISIDPEQWRRLDAINRAALIVHEIIYSLLKLQNCYDASASVAAIDIYAGQICLQNAQRARDLTSLFFTKKTPQQFASSLKIWRDILELPVGEGLRPGVSSLFWTLKSSKGKILYRTLVSSSGELLSLCKNLLNHSVEKNLSSFSLRSARADLRPYKAAYDGIVIDQFRLDMSLADYKIVDNITLTDAVSCLKQLEDQLRLADEQGVICGEDLDFIYSPLMKHAEPPATCVAREPIKSCAGEMTYCLGEKQLQFINSIGNPTGIYVTPTDFDKFSAILVAKSGRKAFMEFRYDGENLSAQPMPGYFPQMCYVHNGQDPCMKVSTPLGIAVNCESSVQWRGDIKGVAPGAVSCPTRP